MSGSVFDRALALERVVDIARQGARAVMGVYEKGGVEVEYKGKNDPVTLADREANAIICEALAGLYPGIPIVAEESDPASFAGWGAAKAAWFVDPLDGTREFIARNGEFAVMIGLAEEGRPVLGVVLCPQLRRSFAGAAGVGAFEIADDGIKTRVHVSSVDTLLQAELVVSRSHRTAELETATARLGVRKLTRCGSAGVKAARVACAEADGYAQPGRAGKLWDGCAPEAIVVAAGGRVTDARGRMIDYRSSVLDNADGLVMTNAAIHDAVLELIAKASHARQDKGPAGT